MAITSETTSRLHNPAKCAKMFRLARAFSLLPDVRRPSTGAVRSACRLRVGRISLFPKGAGLRLRPHPYTTDGRYGGTPSLSQAGGSLRCPLSDQQPASLPPSLGITAPKSRRRSCTSLCSVTAGIEGFLSTPRASGAELPRRFRVSRLFGSVRAGCAPDASRSPLYHRGGADAVGVGPERTATVRRRFGAYTGKFPPLHRWSP